MNIQKSTSNSHLDSITFSSIYLCYYYACILECVSHHTETNIQTHQYAVCLIIEVANGQGQDHEHQQV